MGSFKSIETTIRERMPGKVDALLNQKLEKVEWGEFRIGDLFEIKTGRDVIIGKVESGDIPLISHQHEDNGLSLIHI